MCPGGIWTVHVGLNEVSVEALAVDRPCRPANFRRARLSTLLSVPQLCLPTAHGYRDPSDLYSQADDFGTVQSSQGCGWHNLMPLASPRARECTTGRSAHSVPRAMLLNGHTPSPSLSTSAAASCLDLLCHLPVSLWVQHHQLCSCIAEHRRNSAQRTYQGRLQEVSVGKFCS